MKSHISILTALFCLCLTIALDGSPQTTTLHCPADQTNSCLAQTSNLSAYGEAYVMKNGVQYPAGLASVTKNINSCNVGTIIRHWTIVGDNNELLECSQTLTFLAGNFNITNIHWPEEEYQLAGCDNTAEIDSLPLPYQRPTFDYIFCTNVGISHSDATFTFGPDCNKIIREWTVIDWCNFHPGSSAGVWKFNQVFKVGNDQPPSLSCPLDLTVNPNLCNGADVDLPWANFTGQPCQGNYNIINNSQYADTTHYDASGFYPIGTTLVSYELAYGCGEKLGCQTKVTVSNLITPVPYCLATINVALMGTDTDGDGVIDDGMVDIWAKDVNVNSYHPCNSDPLRFSFDKAVTEMSKTFTCEEVGPNPIRIYVTDNQNRQANCLVNINVQNNGAQIPNCEPSAFGPGMLVSGKITDPSGAIVEDVFVTYKDTESMQVVDSDGVTNYFQMAPRTLSDNNGQYAIEGIHVTRNYEVSAYKPGDITQVTQNDVDILESFIRGESTFSNPFTYLAADINEDGLVDVNDFHLLKNLLGQSEDLWPNQKQWIFFTIDDTTVLNSTPSIYDLSQTAHSQGGQGEISFIGILKGDLDFYEGL